jgi:hypothetical protein
MKSDRTKVTKGNAPAKNQDHAGAGGHHDASLDALCALIPSSEDLKQIVAGPRAAESGRSAGAKRSASIDIPPALLNPRASLPSALSLDEVTAHLRVPTTESRK